MAAKALKNKILGGVIIASIVMTSSAYTGFAIAEECAVEIENTAEESLLEQEKTVEETNVSDYETPIINEDVTGTNEETVKENVSTT